MANSPVRFIPSYLDNIIFIITSNNKYKLKCSANKFILTELVSNDKDYTTVTGLDKIMEFNFSKRWHIDETQ